MNSNIPDSVDVKLKASHFEYINRNAVRYTDKAVKKGTPSWLTPYNKPQLVMHNKTSDPIGRIIDYKIIKLKDTSSEEPPNYIQLTARITDKDAISKVLDGRYNTVSVGSRTSRVLCSECNQVITEDGLCDHKKGSYNEKGDIIHWIIDQLDYTECSFVNEPADDYTKIEEINYGKGWIKFNEFLDNRTKLLAELKLEDCMSQQTDAKLSTETRNKLPESAFCGPGRSFPAHDKAHVTAGLRLLNKSNFSDATKSKIKACLYRKGKRYGIAPSTDELQENPDLLIMGIDDEWSPEQLVELETFFKDNPDADLPSTEDTEDQTNTQTPNLETTTLDIQKLKVGELRDLVIKLQKDIETLISISKETIENRDKKIIELDKKITDSDTITTQREEEINKYLDENAILSKKFRDSVISNILDLKVADNNSEERSKLLDKLSKRQIESLLDSLDDLRINKIANMQTGSEEKILNTTLTDSTNSDKEKKIQNTNEENEDKFSLFNKDRSQITED